MELLSPAGNLEKLKYAYAYGADAVYIGIKDFSLRVKADNFHTDEAAVISGLKGDRKLYCALNIYFHNADLARLESELDYIADYPFDAFIVSDVGAVPLLKRCFPNAKLHLSTQANCTNAEAARVYQDMGFSRIVLGREVSIDEIAVIKAKNPGLELEAFVHGAMCLAYSGRCFLSAWMAGRSGNQGECAHSCRWNYRVLEESERPGEYFPIAAGENFTTILSSRDLCMIDHLGELKSAGVDSIKIEGRMKSLYYTAVVTRAYRKQLDAVCTNSTPCTNDDPAAYRADLFHVSHREYCTGFYFGKSEVERPTETDYLMGHVFLGIIGRQVSDYLYELDIRNQIATGQTIEYIGPDLPHIEDSNFELIEENGNSVKKADHEHIIRIKPGVPVQPGYIIRRV
ncbi:peptidase U32 family protein [Leadbettera azotonutricia]|uniref:Peptidase U32 n=1 Tax=Leadbettera azotonutricia (strain ATCC BAA-888 / DSM 13862 / ZAS-9) TaxID=545695 RepID=F5Y6Y6_LEAAZ|nr:U32 family peptidase [Leadbettera azotonutricia]AEF80316.1 peptidase U32 [Leadbettera azotonutricia ZAS-9]